MVLVKPRTFMNHSGQAVAYLQSRFSAVPSGLLAIYDDKALPCGRIRIRPQGSSGGHNGVQSVIDQLGSQDFLRIRIGIGEPPPGQDQIDYVLGRFSPQEEILIKEALDKVVKTVDCLLEEDLDMVMNHFN